MKMQQERYDNQSPEENFEPDYFNLNDAGADLKKKLEAVKLLFPDAKWLAMDEDGDAMAFDELPDWKDLSMDDNEPNHIWFISEWGSYEISALKEYAPSWHESLIELKEV